MGQVAVLLFSEAAWVLAAERDLARSLIGVDAIRLRSLCRPQAGGHAGPGASGAGPSREATRLVSDPLPLAVCAVLKRCEGEGQVQAYGVPPPAGWPVPGVGGLGLG